VDEYDDCATMRGCTAQPTGIDKELGGVDGEGAWYVAQSRGSGTATFDSRKE